MLKNIRLGLIICGVLLSATGMLWAKVNGAVAETSVSSEVGNKICPVLGGEINEESKATYEYKGKIYNFCCAACIEEFKKNPDKYVKIVNKEMKNNE